MLWLSEQVGATHDVRVPFSVLLEALLYHLHVSLKQHSL